VITATIVLICVLTVLLILVVLVQNSKGGGLTSEFGGSGSNQLMGVKKTTDLLEQITWGLGIGVMVLTLASYIMIDKNTEGAGVPSINADRAATRQLPTAAPTPAPSAAPTPAPAAAPAAAPGNSLSALRP
jgi:preprotein translocase subunit SecG